jgi:hypothetical protein
MPFSGIHHATKAAQTAASLLIVAKRILLASDPRTLSGIRACSPVDLVVSNPHHAFEAKPRGQRLFVGEMHPRNRKSLW